VEVLIIDYSALRPSGSIANMSNIQTAEIADSADSKVLPLRRSETDAVLHILERL
jgi:hypothetical protein